MKINVAGCVQLKSCGLARWCFDIDNMSPNFLQLLHYSDFSPSTGSSPAPSSGQRLSARVYPSHHAIIHLPLAAMQH